MSAPIDADRVSERIAEVRRRIDAHATRPVRIVAVTKRFGVDAVEAAMAAGIEDIGENYAQELLAKHDELARLHPEARPRWHFIGHLQRNKVRPLAEIVSLWQTVDSERLGAEIAKRAPGASVLVQVNLAQNPAQGGTPGPQVEQLVARLDDLGLDVAGLMMIGRAGDDEMTSRLFGELRAMADGLGLPECSMGMTDDLELAVAAGATIVRVGTAIFGPRPD